MYRVQARTVPFILSVCLILVACHAAATTVSQVRAQTTQPQPSSTPTTQQPTTAQPATPQTAVAANPADVNSLDAILAAVYDSISGAKGKARNWDRFRSLFIPGARLIPTFKRQNGEIMSRTLTPEEFITSSGKFMEEQGFFERGVANHIEQFANIAHVFSVYEGRHDTADAKPFLRGINSIQLMNDGKRWWVVTIFWQAEDAANPLPQKYLDAKKK
ncbi:MAG TPA: hypothetical protein VJ842_19290 [Pyrinomonadaceae bacterium]|nr:hypothetical protein [Pyrinomonadaceae bacterium]